MNNKGVVVGVVFGIMAVFAAFSFMVGAASERNSNSHRETVTQK